MNRSQVNPGASLCAIILEDGRDCNGAVSPDSPLNLCLDHLKAAADWYNRNDESTRPRLVCELCGEREALPSIVGYHCGHCGFQSKDFEGSTRITPAERDRIR